MRGGHMPGQRLWHNLETHGCDASTPLIEGLPLCPCAPQPIGSIPEQTARVAHAAFPKGHPYLTLRDHRARFSRTRTLLRCFRRGATQGSPMAAGPRDAHAVSREPGRSPAAEAVRPHRLEATLGLDLTDPGFDFSVLSEFRDRLLAGSAEALLLDKLLEQCRTMGLVKARGQQRTDSTHVLAAIRVMNRLELVAETLRPRSTNWATVAPAWLQAMAPSRGMNATASGSRYAPAARPGQSRRLCADGGGGWLCPSRCARGRRDA